MARSGLGSDITYVPLQHATRYLTAVMDLFSRNVLSWRLSNPLTGGFCAEALEAALRRAQPQGFRGPPPRDAAASTGLPTVQTNGIYLRHFSSPRRACLTPSRDQA
jgi:transposase InsO family protein